jgi:excisionase family DNA binding protein
MIADQISFNNLPEAISKLLAVSDFLSRKVQELSESVEALSHGKEVMDIEEAAKFINKTPSALYTMVHRREIKFHKPDKNLCFFRSDLIDWVKNGKQSAVKIESEVIRKNVVELNKK